MLIKEVDNRNSSADLRAASMIVAIDDLIRQGEHISQAELDGIRKTIFKWALIYSDQISQELTNQLNRSLEALEKYGEELGLE